MSKAWLISGFLGGALALLSAVTWVAGVVGGGLVLISVVLQYIDARPFRREIALDEWSVVGEQLEYQERNPRANGKVNIALFIRTGDRWEHVEADSGIGPKDRFWIAVAKPEHLLVVAR